MKRCILLAILSVMTVLEVYSNNKKVKTGWNFGPLPAVGYSSDLGFQYGALCDIFYYGDGSTFPQYRHKFNVEVSSYTKGSGIFHFFYDSKFLIPGIRMTAAASYLTNQMMPFYGFNGYASPYSYDAEQAQKAFYAMDRRLLRLMLDFQGSIAPNLNWAAGVSYWGYRLDRVKLKKYASQTTLYDIYREAGLIDDGELKGGKHVELKAGLVYDTRDIESDPSRGLNCELVLYGSPDVIGDNGYNYLKAKVSFAQYINLVPDRLTFAYRIAYQGLVAGRQPFYALSNMSTLYLRRINNDGLGGSVTLRGVLYTRVLCNGFAWSNVELRCRLFDFRLFKQNWYLTANPFFDAGAVVQPFRLEQMKLSDSETIYSGDGELFHFSAGAGLKAVMNRNFVISLEWGKPFDKRDGRSGMNIGLNYIF